MKALSNNSFQHFIAKHKTKRNWLLSGLSFFTVPFVLFTLLPGPALAGNSDSIIILDNRSESYPLGLHMDYLEDSSRTLTIQDITSATYRDKFIPHRKEAPSFGFTESAFWYRTEIVNPDPTDRTIILEETTPYIDSIKIYTPDINIANSYDIRHAGDKKLFNDREIRHQYFLFKLTLKPNQTLPVFIRVESRAAVITPFTIWQDDAFEQHALNVNFLYGLFFGTLTIIVIYGLFLFLRMKDRSYLYFALFVVSVALVVATSQGLSYMYLWPESVWLAERMQVVAISLFQIAGLLFARYFLDARATLPRINRFFAALLLLHVFIIGTSAAVDDVIPLAKLTIICLYLYSPLLLFSGVLALRSGNRAARFYLLAWTSSIIGSVITALTLLNVIPYHFILLTAGYMLGFFLDVIFLSLALSDRILVMRQERDLAQQAAHENLQNTKELLEAEVTERTKDLVSAKKEADLANQAKTQFLSNMSHELRTPLIGILGFSELLLSDEETPLTSDHKQHVKTIFESGEHLKALIDDVLNIAIIESGSMAINLEPVTFRDALNEALSVVRSLAQKQEIAIIDATVEEGPFWVAADRLRLRQVIINLMSNAIKYSKSPGRVLLTLEQTDNGVRFSVQDTGPGISQENLSTIFEPFTRLDTHGEGIEGVGIGLTITRKLVNLMNGWITVDSTLGEGSIFSFELPATLATETTKTTAPSQADAASRITNKTVSQHQILYIEDNLSSQIFLEHIFKRRKDIKLYFSSTGKEGLDAAKEHIPDIILTDIRLPDITGFDVLRELKEHKKTAHIPVLAISANATPDDLEKGRDIGFVSYLTKPVEIKQLMDAVNRLLAQGA